MRRGKNSSQAICLCQNLQKKLTESFFLFLSLFSRRRKKKLKKSLAKTGLSILELLYSHGQIACYCYAILGFAVAKEKFVVQLRKVKRMSVTRLKL